MTSHITIRRLAAASIAAAAVLLLAVILSAAPAIAQTAATGQAPAGTPAAPANYALSNPFGKNVGAREVIGRVINIFTGVAGSLALLVFIWGGFTLIISRGNTTMIQSGKDRIIQATIGLIIIFGAYAILSQVFRMIGASA